jgi:uncharacterized repeat protein (TIGR01451 family)
MRSRAAHASSVAVVTGVILLLLVAVPSARAQEGPEIAVDPTEATAGSVVSVTGTGWAGECGANLYLDEVGASPLATAFPGEDGAFTASIVIPADVPPGSHVVVAEGLAFAVEFCGGASGTIARAPITVLDVAAPGFATIVLDRLDGTPGTTVHITGAGFCADPACGEVAVLFAGLPSRTQVEVEPDGTFAADVLIPAGPTVGAVHVAAVQADGAGGEIVGMGEFQITNKPNLRPAPPEIGGVDLAVLSAHLAQAGGTTGIALLAAGGWMLALRLRRRGSRALAPHGTPVALAGVARVRVAPIGLSAMLALTTIVSSAPAPAAAAAPSVLTDVNPDGLPGEPRFGGRALGITISPTNNQNAFVASERGGIWRSTNGGQNWSHVNDVPLTISRDVTYDPQDASILIATGQYLGRTAELGGIWRSTDGGASWSKPATSIPGCTTETSAWGIAIPNDPVEHTNVFVGTTCGIAMSDDSGATWSHVDPCDALDAGFCAAARTYWDVEARVVGGQVQVDACSDEGFFRSTDGGTTWSAPDPASPSLTGLNPCHIATAPGDANTVYLANWSGVNASGFCTSQLLESTTGGTAGSWVTMNVSAANCRDAWVVTHPALDGDASHFEVYYGDSVTMRRQHCDLGTTPRCDAGVANWPAANTGAHSDPSDVAFDSSAANGCPQIHSTDGGISVTNDCGATWIDGNRGYHALDVVTFAGTTQPGQTDLYAGTQDNGIYVTQDGAASWSRPVGADGYNVLADHNPPARVFYRQCFGCNDFIANPGIAGAAGFTDPPGVVPTFARVTQFGPQSYAMITSDGGTPAQWTAYVTTDEGANWAQMGPSPLPGSPGEIKASGPAGSPTFFLRLNVGGTPRIYRLSGPLDATATLALANTGLSWPSAAWDVNPSDPNRLYATDLVTNDMRQSSNGGASWTADDALTDLVTGDGTFRFDSNTLGSHVSAVAFDENSPAIMVGTRTAGLFVSVTDGAAWLNVPGGEPLSDYRDFFFDENADLIYAATQGRGVWRIDLPEADLRVDKADSVDPAVAGEELTYTVTVTNDGPDTAYGAVLVDTLPAGVTHVSDTGGCVESPAGTLTCQLGDLVSGGVAVVSVTVLIDADLVFDAGGPTTIENSASVSSETPDADLADNVVVEETLVVAVADLEIVSFEALDVPVPAEILAGEDVPITFRKVITNHGPSAPMNVTLTSTAVATPGASVVPAVQVLDEPALGLDELREVAEVFTISCLEPGIHTFTFTNTIAPADPLDTDPNPANDTKVVELEVECVIPVAINIKPGNRHNLIPPGRGTINVAILTTEVGEYGLPVAFDATTVQPLSVRFGQHDLVWTEAGGAFDRNSRDHIKDAQEQFDDRTKDGDDDMVLGFDRSLTGLTVADVEGCVKGLFEDDDGDLHKFFGCDFVEVLAGGP